MPWYLDDLKVRFSKTKANFEQECFDWKRDGETNVEFWKTRSGGIKIRVLTRKYRKFVYEFFEISPRKKAELIAWLQQDPALWEPLPKEERNKIYEIR